MARISRDQVAQWYHQYLGRDPYPTENAQVNYWRSQGSAAESGIANSDEARARQGTAAEAAPVDPWESLNKMISDWYSQKPATPATFRYSPEQTAADKLMVGQEIRPEYQEQATQYGEDYTKALQAARAGFSRRGLWGAAGGTEQTIDPATGLAYTTATAPTAGGPVSGLRQVGEERLGGQSKRATTAFGRAYTEAVARETKGRELEAETAYKRQITEPYEQQYQDWLTRMNYLSALK